MILTSMPADPLADDWQINRFRPDDLPSQLMLGATTAQQQLFE